MGVGFKIVHGNWIFSLWIFKYSYGELNMNETDEMVKRLEEKLNVMWSAIWYSILANIVYDLIKIYVVHLNQTVK